jgi:hypothetical protein
VLAGFPTDLDAVPDWMKRVRWTALGESKKNPEVLKKIDELALCSNT